MDQIVTSTGSYTAKANPGTRLVVMQLAAFKQNRWRRYAGQPHHHLQPTVISGTQINLSWTASTTTCVTVIMESCFGRKLR